MFIQYAQEFSIGGIRALEGSVGAFQMTRCEKRQARGKGLLATLYRSFPPRLLGDPEPERAPAFFARKRRILELDSPRSRNFTDRPLLGAASIGTSKSHQLTLRVTAMRAWPRTCATCVSRRREASYSNESCFFDSSTRKLRNP